MGLLLVIMVPSPKFQIKVEPGGAIELLVNTTFDGAQVMGEFDENIGTGCSIVTCCTTVGRRYNSCNIIQALQIKTVEHRIATHLWAIVAKVPYGAVNAATVSLYYKRHLAATAIYSGI